MEAWRGAFGENAEELEEEDPILRSEKRTVRPVMVDEENFMLMI